MKSISLILTLVVVALGMAIVLGLTSIFISSLIASRNVHVSTIAFYVADSGIEAALYRDRNGGVDDSLPFNCDADGDGIVEGGQNEDGDNTDGDFCLDSLTNGGFYTYAVTGESDPGPPQEFRVMISKGRFSNIQRTVQVEF